MKKLRVGILFGGRSGEHEVSLLSAASVLNAIDKDKYEVVPIGITKHGRWVTSGDAKRLLTGNPAGGDARPARAHLRAGDLGSAAGMDKDIMKSLFIAAGIPIVKHVTILRSDWEKNAKRVQNLVGSKLQYPVFVKPANLGSSLGI